MKIPVGEKYRVSSDRYNWMFQEFKGLDKNNKEMWDTWGYWGTIDSLLRCLPDHIARRCEGSDLQEAPGYLDTIEALQDALVEHREALVGILKR